MSEQVEFTIVCCNAGERTARNPLYNFKFGSEFDYLTKMPTRPAQGRFLKSPDDGRPLWVIGGGEHIHPADLHHCDLRPGKDAGCPDRRRGLDER